MTKEPRKPEFSSGDKSPIDKDISEKSDAIALKYIATTVDVLSKNIGRAMQEVRDEERGRSSLMNQSLEKQRALVDERVKAYEKAVESIRKAREGE